MTTIGQQTWGSVQDTWVGIQYKWSDVPLLQQLIQKSGGGVVEDPYAEWEKLHPQKKSVSLKYYVLLEIKHFQNEKH